ncbi:PREDICTED: uncharacterized protein LOC109581225 isoform X2 [Amphimedon queenslandica]|uniref:MRH domain-containing protein n=1 Tax=Amphimedon queenslandica TaxID=400682 RepID=A0AAN0J154_AMPQE|nr:PREDICTED: uncharacterized protein LOC109581225 isoform X2 [Amphimedon queenslandica]|eukprot:XP_019850720.1 PREDICTED: uncharacterized protein LOC109581225 isoform X2 [Amphimedon queenslandica]
MYSWKQSVYDTSNNVLTNISFSDTVNVTIQLGICQNVSSPMSGCSGSGPIFMMRSDTEKCVNLGSLNVARFEPNPFQDGVYMDLYDGDMIDHITRYEARIYFVCSQSELDGPYFEHLKDSNQAHFHVSTKYAC